ncbi:hypothetical protein SVAN01_02632 [Stagonosporopsis vannaccii]|nr:hypothetical protein SVAN01_02632 [Stagonosporopsis vannaccii]
MSTKLFTALLLTAGLATCKPITSPHILRDLGPQQDSLTKPETCASPASSMTTVLTALESRVQGEVTQMRTDSSVLVNIDVKDGGQETIEGELVTNQREEKATVGADRKKLEGVVAEQLLLQGVDQALLADHKANAVANEMDNVLRAVALAQKEPEKTTVILVVQEVKVSIELEVQTEDKRQESRNVDASVFKQEVIVANRGKQETETVLMYNPRTLTAADIARTPEAAATANGTLSAEVSATQTIAAVVYDAKPTHSQVIEDPAKSMRAALEATLEDRQDTARRAEDVELSIRIAVEIKVETRNNNEGNRNDKNGGDNNGDRDGDRDGDREGEERGRDHEREREKQQEAEQRKQEQERTDGQQRQDREKMRLSEQAEQQNVQNQSEEKALAGLVAKAKAAQEGSERKESAVKAKK